jgi:hypothetical protein
MDEIVFPRSGFCVSIRANTGARFVQEQNMREGHQRKTEDCVEKNMHGGRKMKRQGE